MCESKSILSFIEHDSFSQWFKKFCNAHVYRSAFLGGFGLLRFFSVLEPRVGRSRIAIFLWSNVTECDDVKFSACGVKDFIFSFCEFIIAPR